MSKHRRYGECIDKFQSLRKIDHSSDSMTMNSIYKMLLFSRSSSEPQGGFRGRVSKATLIARRLLVPALRARPWRHRGDAPRARRERGSRHHAPPRARRRSGLWATPSPVPQAALRIGGRGRNRHCQNGPAPPGADPAAAPSRRGGRRPASDRRSGCGTRLPHRTAVPSRLKRTSSHPRRSTVTTSPSLAITVVVSASKIAGPTTVMPGSSASIL